MSVSESSAVIPPLFEMMPTGPSVKTCFVLPDPILPIFALPGEMMPTDVGPMILTLASFAFATIMEVSSGGTYSVRISISGIPASIASSAAPFTALGGTTMSEVLIFGCLMSASFTEL